MQTPILRPSHLSPVPDQTKRYSLWQLPRLEAVRLGLGNVANARHLIAGQPRLPLEKERAHAHWYLA